ncbi:DUF2971 domain-containing protein [Hyphomicrobium sp. CS1GBMeth3]|uniref:DUF2971 domain-containing protein n=1 Tax=Hyphomicrobium sp. CS1GBMeth3 TaxID=1892845 RepID=UPI000AC1F4FA|nr:DUF2971 domain-containing protein [Hyphomicrobium sp. CS1GBMeth3]
MNYPDASLQDTIFRRMKIPRPRAPLHEDSLKIHNPFGRLPKAEGAGKLQRWPDSYQRPFDGKVYHYTTAAALGGILSSRSMFCTDYRQLNDSAELSIGLEVVEAAISARGQEIGISSEDAEDALDHLAVLREASMHVAMFAASFSMHGNDLTQWRAYVPSHGVSVGFRLSALEKLAVDQHFVCGPVRYLGAPIFNEWLTAQLEVMRDGLRGSAISERALREQASSDPQEFVDLMVLTQRSGNLERWICEVAGLLKNPDFRSEREWRCLFVQRENTIQPRKPAHFRSSGPRVIRYVELDFSQVDLNELIDVVLIGPGTSREETFQLVTDLLRSAGVNATVSCPPNSLR